MRSKKPCQPNTAKRIFGGPGSQGPSGQAKERTRILPVRRGSFCPACRAIWQAGRSCAAGRCCAGFRARCSGIFLPVCHCLVPGLRLSAVFCLACAACLPFALRRPCSRLAGRLPLLCLARAAGACSPFVCRALCFGCLFICLCCLRGFSLLFFTLSCLTSSSQISFHLSLRPRRASTFFRKESRQRFAKGLRPFEPHSCALRSIFSSSALLAGLTALRAANRRQVRETLEKPRSRAQLFKRFCAKGDACALSLISPFFWLLAGLRSPSGRKPPAGKGNA